MRLVFATRDLIVGGRCFEGLPILLGNDCQPIEPIQTFIWKLLTSVDAPESPLTWEAYGRGIYDYFAFLGANTLEWDADSTDGLHSVVLSYRAWSTNELGLNVRTVNRRLRLVVKFYEWALSKGLISSLPFGYRDIVVRKNYGLLAHVDSSPKRHLKPDILTSEGKTKYLFATQKQVAICLTEMADNGHQILFKLMRYAGLRSCEARTFPLKYVFNPNERKDLPKGRHIRVVLYPRDMYLKRGKDRGVDIPWSLMEELWRFSIHEREARLQKSGRPCTPLVINIKGRPFARSSVVSLFTSLSRAVGFYIRAHMLRHSYGTYTLANLRRNKAFEGEPLTYVRDRMGHENVETTLVYLHCINDLESQLALSHEEEIDKLFGCPPFETVKD